MLCYGRHPSQRLRGVFCCLFFLKIVRFTKNQLFFEKIVEKICTYQKKAVPLQQI